MHLCSWSTVELFDCLEWLRTDPRLAPYVEDVELNCWPKPLQARYRARRQALLRAIEMEEDAK